MDLQQKINLDELLAGKRTVGMAGHVRPDGDCVGSTVGLMLYLKDNFPQLEEVDVYLQEVPENLRVNACTDAVITKAPEGKVYDLFISLDCAAQDRMGRMEPLFVSAKETACIDHHISNPGYADHNYIVGTASSTCELLCTIADMEKISVPAAEALYMGIAHDTGIFQYSCTSPKTMEIAAELMRKGINYSEIVSRTYYEKTYVQNQILGKALLESMMLLDGQCIATVVSKEDMKFFQAGSADLEGIVSQLRETKGVETAIFLHELSAQSYKVSLRSKEKVDVSRVAAYFGGGGHVRAAGVTMKGSAQDVLSNLCREIKKQLDEE